MTFKDKWSESNEAELRKQLEESIEFYELDDEQEIKEQEEILRLNISLKSIIKENNYKLNCCNDVPYFYENFYHELEKDGREYGIEFVILTPKILKEITFNDWNLIDYPNNEFMNIILNGLRDYGYLILRQYDAVQLDEEESVGWFETQFVLLKNDVYFEINIY